MQNWLYLYDTALVCSLAIHFGDPPHTVVASEVPIGPRLPNRDDARIPDLLVAFECDLVLLKEQRGYSIESQGGPPMVNVNYSGRSCLSPNGHNKCRCSGVVIATNRPSSSVNCVMRGRLYDGEHGDGDSEVRLALFSCFLGTLRSRSRLSGL